MTTPMTTEADPLQPVTHLQAAVRKDAPDTYSDVSGYPPTMAFILKRILRHVFKDAASPAYRADGNNMFTVHVNVDPIRTKEIVDLATQFITMSAMGRINDPFKPLPYIVVNTPERAYSVFITEVGIGSEPVEAVGERSDRLMTLFNFTIQEHVCRSES